MLQRETGPPFCKNVIPGHEKSLLLRPKHCPHIPWEGRNQKNIYIWGENTVAMHTQSLKVLKTEPSAPRKVSEDQIVPYCEFSSVGKSDPSTTTFFLSSQARHRVPTRP